MKRFVCAAFALLLVFGLCACGETAAPAAPAAVETAEPTPEITPEPELKIELPHGITADKETKTLDLSAFTASELKDAAKSIAELPALEEVKLGGEAESVLPQIVKENPGVHFVYAFELNGIETDLDAEALDLSGMAAEDFDSVLPLVSCMKNVRSISLGDERNVTYTIEQLNALHEACPAAVIDYVVRIYDQRINLKDEEIKFRYVKIEDEAELIRELIPCMTELKEIRLDHTGVSDETMAEMRDTYTELNVVWRVFFGEKYSCMTDTEMILASCPDLAGELTDENIQSLKYCNKVKYLDIGHNNLLRHIDFIRYMPDLEVGILAMLDVEDWDVLAECPKLEYLELFTTCLHDLTPLSGLKNLRHLNICYNFAIRDISPLYSLTELERLYIGCYDPVPPEQIEEMQRCAPNCRINTTTSDPTEENWRYEGGDALGNDKYHPRYKLLRQQFGGYDMDDYTIDPMYMLMLQKPY